MLVFLGHPSGPQPWPFLRWGASGWSQFFLSIEKGTRFYRSHVAGLNIVINEVLFKNERRLNLTLYVCSLSCDTRIPLCNHHHNQD